MKATLIQPPVKKVDFLLALASYWKNNNNSAWSIRTMSHAAFPHLFEPLVLRGKRLKKRIMSSGHDTSMPTDNLSQIFHPGREIMESADGLLAHFSR